MPETEMRKVIDRLMKYDVLISLPGNAGLGVEIKKALPCIKRMVQRANNPLRVEGTASDGVPRSFIFGETSKMKENPSYLNEFINMAKYTGGGSKIGII